MMPVCGFKKRIGRCQDAALHNVGTIDTGDEDGYGKPWIQTHYLCEKHWRKLLHTLGFAAPKVTEDGLK